MSYDADFLRQLRNDIAIDRIIKDILKLPVRYTNQILRFECPRCRNRHTAISREHNLARCFDCNRSYNPIDLVMAVTQSDFVETVEFLKKYL